MSSHHRHRKPDQEPTGKADPGNSRRIASLAVLIVMAGFLLVALGACAMQHLVRPTVAVLQTATLPRVSQGHATTANK